MSGSAEDVSDTMNVALACAAAFQVIHMQNAKLPGSIRSVAVPGLGANTGKVPVEICADLMWTAYNLFREREFTDFGDLRKALEGELGDLGTTAGKAQKAGGGGAVATKAAPKDDFDDHDDEEDDKDDEEDDDGEDKDFDDHH